MSSYSELLRKLYKVTLFHPSKIGLTSMEKMYSLIGKPLEYIPVVHVAGTNGKGSVALKIANCLQSSGLKTGLYTSPHISSFRERIQVNREIVSVEDIETLLPEVLGMCQDHQIPATFFEITTVMAFMKFVRANCDVVVLECGLGGRLDATNVIKTPAVSVISSIQRDHCYIFGDKLSDIAKEKTGIAKKRGIYGMIVGPGCPNDVIKEEIQRICSVEDGVEMTQPFQFYELSDILTANERNYVSPEHELNENVKKYNGLLPFADIDCLNADIARSVITVLRGDEYYYKRQQNIIDQSAILTRRYQLLNEKLASISMEHINEALLVRPPCRFELFRMNGKGVGIPAAPGTISIKSNLLNELPFNESDNVDVILDIAHNEGAMISLVEKLKCKYGANPAVKTSFRFVVGMSSDKDIRKSFEALRDGGVVHSLSYIHTVQASNGRAAKTEQLQSIVEEVFNGVNLVENTVVVPQHELVGRNIGITGENIAYESVFKGMQAAIASALKHNRENPASPQVVIVCGSAYIMPAARSAIGIIEPNDDDVFGKDPSKL